MHFLGCFIQQEKHPIQFLLHSNEEMTLSFLLKLNLLISFFLK